MGVYNTVPVDCEDKEVQAAYLLKMSEYHIKQLRTILARYQHDFSEADWQDCHSADIHALDVQLFLNTKGRLKEGE